MKKLFTYLLVAITMIVAGCSESFDDSKIWDKLDDHENRIAKLEELCKQMNTNISSLQTIVNALQNNDYVTGVTPITKDGKTVGYTITFTKSQPITIYHGEDGKDGQNGTDGKDGKDGADGKDGSTPIIGVKQDTDGIYYWTLNGEWLLDANGNKIKAQGTDGKDGTNGEDGKDGANGTNGKDGEDGKDGVDGAEGKDGITPQLKIENDYWYISYDNGASWTQLGKATGEDGTDGENGANGADGTNGVDGDSFFQGVDTSNDEFVIFILADGTEITIPRQKDLSIIFDAEDLVVMAPNSTHSIGYTITSATGKADIEVTSSADIKAEVVANNATNLTGAIQISTGATIDEYSKVIVLVTNGSQIIMKRIAFEEPGLTAYDATQVYALSAGGSVELEFLSNTACVIAIPEEAQSWLYTTPDSRTLTHQKLLLKVRSNEGAERSAVVKVQTLDGSLSVNYTIIQLSGVSISKNNEISYTSSNGVAIELNVKDGFGASFVANTYDAEMNLGTITFSDDITTIPDNAFKGVLNLTSIQLPNSIISIGKSAFYACSGMQHITIPSSVKNIGESAFQLCRGEATIKCNVPEKGFMNSGFNSVVIGDNVTQMGSHAFEHSSLAKLYIPSSVKTIAPYAFAQCGYLCNVELEYGIEEIGEHAFGWNYALESIKLPDSVMKLGEGAFITCEKLKEVDMPLKMSEIGEEAFANCYQLKEFVIPQGITHLSEDLFRDCHRLSRLFIPSTVESTSLLFQRCSLSRVDIEDLDKWCEVKLVIPAGTLASPANFSPFAGNPDGGYYYIDGEKLTDLVWDKAEVPAGLFAHTNIESVTLTQQVISVGECAFYHCKNLHYITLPNSIGGIGSTAFAQSNLIECILPDNIGSVSWGCFSGCAQLKSLTIPQNVLGIGEYALSGCTNLLWLYLKGSTPPTFSSIKTLPSTVTIYVPEEYVELYKNHSDWSAYANRIKGYAY